MSVKEKILQQLAENPVIIYMKGVPSAPECGFSAKTVGILNETKVPYAYVNVLQSPFIREKLPSISKWPTFPQVFIKGELVGGADIVESMYKDGTLLPLLQATVQPAESADASQTITHSEVEALILASYPGATIGIEGAGCDLNITVVSELFADQAMIKQHQGVMATLSAPLASGRLHAVTLKTHTPAAWAALQPAANPGLLQIQI
ncbi:MULTISPECIES: Grx4 family monothiol glutaredoxin [Methylomonas]|uniref:Glutaredoxin n=2 Tax=Methylomonas TaxID=416 RepID=A0A126T618_9GAMM|nr:MULTISPECIES: Grx4 family monothiol glutaredoxin [Methylomonas]AMK77512.1 glutaredoxin [Methylomonas denitrificans]OAI05094.1 glutaredoxin [Methylomonas methanica]TCV84447.1 monothiol glutaredoxin [Methylomonas methanica]